MPMMGGHHAISGTAAWMALAGSATVRGHQAGLGLWALSSAQGHAGALLASRAALPAPSDAAGPAVSRDGGLRTGTLSRAGCRAAGLLGATHTQLTAVAFTALAAFVK